jgi:tetratricopeptide (TPR) repeat protein
MPAQCPNCGFENPDGFGFCGKCGTRLDAPPPAPIGDERDEAMRRLKAEGDAAKQRADPSTALDRYQQALALLDSTALSADATLHVQFLKARFDILAERHTLWIAAGHPERVEPDLQEMLALARRSGDGTRLAKGITTLAHFHLAHRSFDAAQPLLEEAVSLMRSQADRAGEAGALAELARVNWRAGRLERVPDAFQRAHELRRHVAEPAGLARSYFDLGWLYRDAMSHPFHAISHFEKSIELAHQVGDADLETRGLVALGVSWSRLGDYARAQSDLETARHKAAESKSAEHLAWQLVAQTDALRETGSGEARAVAERAVATAADLDLPDLEWQALAARVRVGQAESTWHDARASIERMQALERAGSLHAYCAIWSNALLARTLLHTGQSDVAATASAEAVTRLQAHGFTGVPTPQTIVWTHFEVLSSQADPSAFHFLRQARELMLSQANTIGDGALRAHFLRDVSINRAIGDDWARAHA